MRKIIFFILALIGGYTVYHTVSDAVNSSTNTISISDIKNNPGLYSDSLIMIEATVVESTTLLNCTKSTVTDDKNSITLFSNKPFHNDGKIKLSVHLYTLYQKNNEQVIFLVDKSLKIFYGILPMLTHAVTNF